MDGSQCIQGRRHICSQVPLETCEYKSKSAFTAPVFFRTRICLSTQVKLYASGYRTLGPSPQHLDYNPANNRPHTGLSSLRSTATWPALLITKAVHNRVCCCHFSLIHNGHIQHNCLKEGVSQNQPWSPCCRTSRGFQRPHLLLPLQCFIMLSPCHFSFLGSLIGIPL